MGELGSCAQGEIALQGRTAGLAVEHLGHELVARVDVLHLGAHGEELVGGGLAEQLLLIPVAEPLQGSMPDAELLIGQVDGDGVLLVLVALLHDGGNLAGVLAGREIGQRCLAFTFHVGCF